MISQLRPLGISLLLHAFILGLFLFYLVGDREKKITHPLKILISTYATSVPSKHSAPPHPNVIQQPKQTFPNKVSQIQPIVHPQIQQSAPALVTPIIVPSSKPSPLIQAPPVSEIPKPSTITTIQLSPPINVEKEFLDAHLGEIRALLIQNLRYPRNAQRLKIQGEVRVSFRLKSDGSVDNVEVVKSSGFEILDEDAIALIKNSASQFPKPAKNISLSIPLGYLLH